MALVGPKPMFYRRKLLLGLLEALDRPLTHTALQKYLFLVCVDQDNPSYEFVPFHYGCYSFQAAADKRTLSKYGRLRDSDLWIRNKNYRYVKHLDSADFAHVCSVVESVGHLRGERLIRYVYEKYPYYAINSQIADKLLDSRNREAVNAARPTGSPARLFTIGYEGRTLEGYLNDLIAQNIQVLCDVRRNPISRKFGFSKRQLQGAVEGLGMEYIHIPELGIDSAKRRDLESDEDYRILFDDYTRTTLVDQQPALDRIAKLIRSGGRIALTCYEASPTSCHRGCVVEALRSRSEFRHRVMHL